MPENRLPGAYRMKRAARDAQRTTAPGHDQALSRAMQILLKDDT